MEQRPRRRARTTSCSCRRSSSLLRDRRLKGRARAVLVSYGEPVVDALAHFLRDPDEDIWVRRHIPATLAQIPSQKSVDVLDRPRSRNRTDSSATRWSRRWSGCAASARS